MKDGKDKLIEQTKEQANPYAAQATDWEIVSTGGEPFHGQRDKELLKEATKTRGKSKQGKVQARLVETSNAAKPRGGRALSRPARR